MASGWRPSTTPAISNEPLPTSDGAVRGAPAMAMVSDCSMMAASAMVATNVASGGRVANGRMAMRAARMPTTPIASATSGSSSRAGRPVDRPTKTATAPPSTTRSPCAKFTAPAAFSASTKPSATSA